MCSGMCIAWLLFNTSSESTWDNHICDIIAFNGHIMFLVYFILVWCWVCGCCHGGLLSTNNNYNMY